MRSFRSVVTGLAVATSAILGGVTPAAAHDQNWGGLYIGASAGWIGSDIGWTYHDNSGVIADRPIRDQGSDSVLYGGHIGIQHQIGQWVLGVEASASSNGNSKDFGSTPCFVVTVACQARFDGYLLTLGPRLGWTPSNQWLVYVTGGIATASVQTREVLASGATANFSRDTHTGWFAGGGVEYALNKNWLLGLEYKHYEFDEKLHVSTSLAENRNIRMDADSVTARLTFKLGRPETHHETLK